MEIGFTLEISLTSLHFQVSKDLIGKPLQDAAEDQSLPICWKGSKPFKSVQDVRSYFKPLQMKYTKAKNMQLEIPPEAYLVITV